VGVFALCGSQLRLDILDWLSAFVFKIAVSRDQHQQWIAMEA